jgi:hypothetical protein
VSQLARGRFVKERKAVVSFVDRGKMCKSRRFSTPATSRKPYEARRKLLGDFLNNFFE